MVNRNKLNTAWTNKYPNQVHVISCKRMEMKLVLVFYLFVCLGWAKVASGIVWTEKKPDRKTLGSAASSKKCLPEVGIFQYFQCRDVLGSM